MHSEAKKSTWIKSICTLSAIKGNTTNQWC